MLIIDSFLVGGERMIRLHPINAAARLLLLEVAPRQSAPSILPFA